LNLLAYAVLDDKLGTDTVDRFIANYCDTVLREKYAPIELATPLSNDQESVKISAGQSYIEMVNAPVAEALTPIETYQSDRTADEPFSLQNQLVGTAA
jgi:hypothetical protein